MKPLFKQFLIISMILLCPVLIFAQKDNLGTTDTLYAEVAKINDLNWAVTFSYVNDEPIIAMSVPFKMTAGPNRIVADSVVYVSGRVDSFAVKTFRADTAIQCVTLGFIANLGPTNHNMAPGKEAFAKVFVSSLEEKPIEMLKVDTTTTSPNNSLLFIAETPPDIPMDSTKLVMEKTTIIPVFKVREPK